MSWNGTVRCSECYKKGHNRNGCPDLKESMQKRIEADPEDWYAKNYFEKKQRRSKRTCGYCKQEGHNRKTCSEAKQDRQRFIDQNQIAREKALDWLKKQGIGVGTLVKRESYYEEEHLALVEQVQWASIHSQTVLVDGNGVGVPDISCLVVAKVDGSSARGHANPKNTEVIGTIPGRLVAAQVPYSWLVSKDEPTLDSIEAELKANSMSYIRRYILKTEESPY
jgi:hypothetical protein